MPWNEPPAATSLPCNPQTLLFHRKRHRWTQAELANVSGYTERLIVKAESGKPIKVQTIEDLADTFSCNEFSVSPEDLIAHPVKLAKELIFGWYMHEAELFSKVKYFLDPQIEFTFAGDPNIIPFAGTHRGLAELERAFAIFFSIMEAPSGDYDFRSPYSFVVNENNPNEVIVWGTTCFRVKGKPLQVPLKVELRLLFRDGKLIYVDDRFDTQMAQENISQGSEDATFDDGATDKNKKEPGKPSPGSDENL